METDGRDTNRAGSSGVDNVVPFPRDWIGPLDDLVPIGPSAEGGPEDQEIGDVFAADAFWSEGSASLHQVIESPEEGALGVSEPAAEIAAFEDGSTTTRWERAGRRSRGAVQGRFRATALAAAAACIAAAAALVVGLGSSAPATGNHPALAMTQRHRTGSADSVETRESLRLSRLLVARAISETSSRSGRARRSGTRRHSAAHKAAAASSGEPAAHVNVSYDTAPPTTAAPTAPSESDSSAEAETSNQSNASDTSSSSSSGPVGAGAPFGPGQLTGG